MKTLKTKIQAVRAMGAKGAVLSHGAGNYSVNGVDIKIWGNDIQGYTCNWETAKKLELAMVR